MKNRRQFTRVLFSIKAELKINEQCFEATIHDISLNGALVSIDAQGQSLQRQLGLLSFYLDDPQMLITMNVAVVHQEEHEIGLQCNGIDIDSVSLLRRLVELNLGDDAQLHKELSQLTREED